MIKVNFNSNDDSHVDITAEVSEQQLVKGIRTESLVTAMSDLLEIYPNDSIRTILKDRVDITMTQTTD